MEKFPTETVFLGHPKIRLVLYQTPAILAQHTWSKWPKEGCLSLFLALPSLSLTIVFPPVFPSQYKVHFILTSLFTFLQFPFLAAGLCGVSRGRGFFRLLVISQALRFGCRLPTPCCASHMVFHLLCSLVSGPFLGKKIVCSEHKNFQTAKPPR